MKFTETLALLHERNLIDDAQAAVVANAHALPQGEWGFCLLAIKGRHLYVLDTGMHNEVGELMYAFDLRQVSNVKTSTFCLNPYLKFDYQGKRVKLYDFGNAKKFVAVFEERRKL